MPPFFYLSRLVDLKITAKTWCLTPIHQSVGESVNRSIIGDIVHEFKVQLFLLLFDLLVHVESFHPTHIFLKLLWIRCSCPFHIILSQLVIFLDFVLEVLLRFKQLGNLSDMALVVFIVSIGQVGHQVLQIPQLSFFTFVVKHLLGGFVRDFGRNLLFNFDVLDHSDPRFWLFRFFSLFRFLWLFLFL